MNADTRIVEQVKKERDYQEYLDKGIDIDKRWLDISGDVDEEHISIAKRAIKIMVANNNRKPIDIDVSTWGGCPHEAVALYDILRSLPKKIKIRTYAFGKLMSAGLLLFLAGDERISGKGTRFMMHMSYSGVEGYTNNIIRTAKEWEAFDRMWDEITASRTKMGAEWWRNQQSKGDYYIGADRAKELGVVTKILRSR